MMDTVGDNEFIHILASFSTFFSIIAFSVLSLLLRIPVQDFGSAVVRTFSLGFGYVIHF